MIDDYAEASSHLQEMINIYAMTGDRHLKAIAQRAKAEILIHLGENTAAKALLIERRGQSDYPINSSTVRFIGSVIDGNRKHPISVYFMTSTFLPLSYL